MFIKNKREKMENYNNDKNTYITRMNKTALSKFDVLKPYLKKKLKYLIMVQEFPLSLLKVFNKQVRNTMLMIFHLQYKMN